MLGANPQALSVGDAYVELNATALDNVDGDISVNIVIDATAVNINAVGSYPVTYNVSDTVGNAAPQVTRTVNVSDSTPLVLNLTVTNGKSYEVDALESGKPVYIDRTYTYTEYPLTFDGQSYIRTANNDKFGRGENFLTFEVTRSVTVYVLMDTRTTQLPGWLENGSWSLEPGSVYVLDTTPPVITLLGANPQTLSVGDAYVELNATALDNVDGDISVNIVIDATAVNINAVGSYPVTYNVSDTVGNAAPQVTRTVNVSDSTPLVLNLNVTNGKSYEVDALESGKTVYIDRTYSYTTYPPAFDGQTLIRTANNDKSGTAVNFLTFDVAIPVTVYVLMDSRTTQLPGWLGDGSWSLELGSVGTTDVPHVIYSKAFPAGQIALGGEWKHSYGRGFEYVYSGDNPVTLNFIAVPDYHLARG